MKQYIEAEVIGNRELGGGAFALDLLAPGIAAAAIPGQFVMIRRGDNLETITPRPISILGRFATSEGAGITLLVEILGAGTRAISATRPGDCLPINGPLGNGLELDPGRDYILAAGGTGIAPAAFAAQRLRDLGGSYRILYGGRSAEQVHLSELARVGVEAEPATEDGSLGQEGLVTDLLVRALEGAGAETLVFTCGPWAMMRAAADICAEAGVECLCSLERYMACGFGVCLSCIYRSQLDGRYHTCCKDGPVIAGREVDWDA